ncbi:hypothetical protein [Bizionia arctica]|uniref:Uncharacterized protein n=1 Tax=Bizionia arctica TaxID=1495645 RepID=A0A917GXN3_9FLAO|nr:hypothetical protein [Bizionia arctica]GGG60118.1 hypothetical protein GCM10010976_33600 [Bizionia arctica]
MKFVKHIILSIAGIFVFGLIMNFIIKRIALKDFKIKADKTILVFGDSHAECNFYDEGNEIQNFGVRSEAPNFTLLKAQHLLKPNSNQKIVMTLSPHNISNWREKQYYEQDSSAGMISKYWSLIGHRYLLNNYSSLPVKTRALLHLKKVTGAPNIESSFLVKNNFKGGFYRDKDTTILSSKFVKKSFQRHFGDENFNNKNIELSSEKFKKYFIELIDFTTSTNEEVIIIGTPVHEKYLSLLSQEQYGDYKLFLSQLQEEFPKIQILDYTELSIPDNFYLDSDHLNFEGAKYFTELVIEEINN